MILYIEIFKTPPKNYYNSLMNSVKLQDTKLIYRNLLHFHILTMNYQRNIKKNTIPRNKSKR